MAIGRVLVSGLLVLSLAACGSDDTVKQTDPGMTTGSGGAGPGTGGAPDPGLSVRPAPAGPLFDDTVLHQISITMTPEDWQSILDDSREDEWRHATLVYDGVTVPDVGIRPSGESSRFPGNPKMSMRVRFDAFEGRGKFGGVDVLKLKGFYGESSMLRDRTAYFMFRKVMPTPQAAHARVMVNGELRGVFGVIEILGVRRSQGALQRAARRALSAARGQGHRPLPPHGRQPEILRAVSVGAEAVEAGRGRRRGPAFPEGPRRATRSTSSRPPTSTTCSRTWRSTRSSTTRTGWRVTPASRTTTSTSIRPAGSSSFCPGTPTTPWGRTTPRSTSGRSTPGSARAGCSRSSATTGTTTRATSSGSGT